MVGYAKNAPKDEDWLREELEGVIQAYYGDSKEPFLVELIIAKMKEGGFVSSAYLKDALSREMASGFRLGLNKSKEVNDD